MDYEQFDAGYRRVAGAAMGGLSTADLAAEIERLRQLTTRIEDPDDREDAGHDVATLEYALAGDAEPPTSPAMTEAVGAA